MGAGPFEVGGVLVEERVHLAHQGPDLGGLLARNPRSPAGPNLGEVPAQALQRPQAEADLQRRCRPRGRGRGCRGWPRAARPASRKGPCRAGPGPRRRGRPAAFPLRRAGPGCAGSGPRPRGRCRRRLRAVRVPVRGRPARRLRAGRPAGAVRSRPSREPERRTACRRPGAPASTSRSGGGRRAGRRGRGRGAGGRRGRAPGSTPGRRAGCRGGCRAGPGRSGAGRARWPGPRPEGHGDEGEGSEEQTALQGAEMEDAAGFGGDGPIGPPGLAGVGLGGRSGLAGVSGPAVRRVAGGSIRHGVARQQAVAVAAHALDPRRGDLAAQAGDDDLDGVRIDVGVAVVDPLDELAARHHPVLAQDQAGEHPPFEAGELQGQAVALEGAEAGIVGEGTAGHAGSPRAPSPGAPGRAGGSPVPRPGTA